MRTCSFCNGKLEEIDDIGTEECLLCGTIYKVLPMKRNDKDEPKE